MKAKSWLIIVNSSLILSICLVLSGCGSGPPTETPAMSPEVSPLPSMSPPAPQEDSMSKSFNYGQEESEAVHRALAKLPKGDLYYDIPSKMKVQKESIIEVVLTPKINQKIQEELDGHVWSAITKGVKYSGSGVEMKLIARKEDFDIFLLSAKEKQRVFKDTPGNWKWSVKPLKPGKKIITLQALVYIGDSKIQESDPYEVFSKEIPIEANLSYSFTQFLSTNWKEIVGLVLGSGSLASGVTWWLGQRKIKAKSPPEQQEKDAVVGRK